MRAIVMTQHGGPEVLTDPRAARSRRRARERSSSASGPSGSTTPTPTCARACGRSGSRSWASSASGSWRRTPAARWSPGPPSSPWWAASRATATAATPSSSPSRRPTSYPSPPGLGWADLAAIPEVYATAWMALHGNLAIARGETVLVRGATSSVGQAAVNLAVDAGATVIATTRTPERVEHPARAGRRRGPHRRRPARRPGPRHASARNQRGPRSRRQLRPARLAPVRRATRAGVPDRLSRRARSRDRFQPARGPAQRGRAQHLRQRVRAGRRGVPDRRRYRFRRSWTRPSGARSRPVRRACSPSIRSSRPTASWRPAGPEARSSSRFDGFRRLRE